MRFALIAITLLLFFNVAFASQLLNRGYFLYNNLTVQNGESISVAVNTSSNVNLLIIPSSDFGSYINGGRVDTLYNDTVVSGIYQFSLGPGNYTIISDALQTTSLDVGVVALPSDKGSSITLNGVYRYNFTISNYSDVHISLLSSADYSGDPLSVAVSGISTSVNTNSNLDTLNLTLNKGKYSLVLKSSDEMRLFVYLNATNELVNPLSQVMRGGNYSIGVASYGLYNISGKLYPYQVLTDEVVGVANITALKAYEPAPPANTSANGASLQLNVGLDTHINNKLRVFWLQDVVDFNTSSDTFYFVDNVWNNTDPSANLTRGTLIGGGNLSACSSCGNQTFYVDSYPVYYLNYLLPFSVKLIVAENQTPRGSQVNFGYQVFRNGTYALGPMILFDRVLIPGSSNTTLITTPFYETPAEGGTFGNYYDTEFVFGGESSGADAYFRQLNASLWIYYNDNGTITPFPSVYTFGLSTAESATGITVGRWSDGALVTTGPPDLTTDIFAGNSLGNIAKYISSTSNYTSPATTIAAAGSSVQANGITPSELGTFELILGLAGIFIIILGFFLLSRH